MKESLTARDKEVLKNSRDGAVKVNLSTGETERISEREQDAVLKSETAENSVATPKVGGMIQGEIGRRIRKNQVKQAQKANKTRVERLHFTAEERADSALEKPIKKADKALDKAEKARAKIWKAKRLTVEKVLDEPTGKTVTRLKFAEKDKPPNGKFHHNRAVFAQTTGMYAHGKIRDAEQENVGVEAAHKAEEAVEGAGRRISHNRRKNKLKPYRAAAKAEKRAVKANAEAVYQKALRDDPQLAAANPLSKAIQKRKIKREYAKSVRRGAGSAAQKIAVAAKKAAQKSSALVGKFWKEIAIGIAAMLLLCLVFAGLSSCMSMTAGGFNSVISTSYTAEDSDIVAVEAAYTGLETALKNRIANIQSEYPGYDEYRFDLYEVTHDPFELASYLTAKFNSYTLGMVQGELQNLFNQQYILTFYPVTETRYRTETRTGSYTEIDPYTGRRYTRYYTYTVEVPYNYYILIVSLVNNTICSVAAANLTPEQLEMYVIYLETKGNKPDVFAGN